LVICRSLVGFFGKTIFSVASPVSRIAPDHYHRATVILIFLGGNLAAARVARSLVMGLLPRPGREPGEGIAFARRLTAGNADKPKNKNGGK